MEKDNRFINFSWIDKLILIWTIERYIKTSLNYVKFFSDEFIEIIKNLYWIHKEKSNLDWLNNE